MPVVTALSVSEQISNVGAYAGLASILGLAVLSLLYFGQARELKRLREWAGRAPERTAELQEQANQAAAAAAQRRPGAPPAAPVRAAAPAPAAPALAASASATAARPAATTQAATAAGAAAAGASAPGTAPPVPPPEAAPVASPGAAPVTWAPSGAPSAASPPAAGAGQETQALPAVPALPPDTPLPDAVPSVVASVPIGPAAPPTDDSPVPLRHVNAATGPGQPRRRPAAEPEPTEPRASGGIGGRRLGVIAGAVAAVVVLVVIATQVFGGGSTPKKATSSQGGNPIVAPSTPKATQASVPPVNPGAFHVYVLNGTTQNGIAAEVAKTLETAGFRSAGTGNAAVSTEAITQVFYAPGKKKGASVVAKKLNVKATDVKPTDPNITVAAPGADVVVQIGADKAKP